MRSCRDNVELACVVQIVASLCHACWCLPERLVFFFFQAEDGIRDLTVTGVQTCALPISEQGESVQSVYRAYKELSLSRQGLKEIYILTLTLTLLLALLSAIALAFLLSRRLSNPLAVLAESTQAVARGDFSRRARVTSRDELGILTQSFNSMTQQLGEAQDAADRKSTRLNSSHSQSRMPSSA